MIQRHANAFSLSKRCSQEFCLAWRNDLRGVRVYRLGMSNWFLSEWLAYFNQKQSDAARELDWNKAKVSLTAAGKQPYNRDDVDQVCEWLGLDPHELLMSPREALDIRQLRETAQRIAAGEYVSDEVLPDDEFTEPKITPAQTARTREIRKRTGTHG